MPIEIRELKTKSERKKFITFPFELYKNNQYWVPPLIMEEMNTLNPKQNPAFDFCEMKLWMAFRDGKAVGRIAGFINHRANETWKQKQARFGWIDFIDDQEVADSLYKTVEDWAKSMGMHAVHGPLGFTDMDKEGMLIEGFNELGTIATIYNHPYYQKLTENAGYVKDTDWVEYEIKPDEVRIPEKHLRIAEIVRQKFGLRVLQFKKTKDVVKYGKQIFNLLNEAFAPLYGFMPLTEKQVNYYIKMYFSFVVPEFIAVIVDKDDNVIAFGITLPSLSLAMQKAKGRLFPFGFIYLLRALKRSTTIDLYLIAVKPEYQNKGVNAMLFTDLIPKYIKRGFKTAETNVELEDNEMVKRQWEYFSPRQHKRRRAFIKHLSN
jgi:GNAT superfamily N-acetyltransferase